MASAPGPSRHPAVVEAFEAARRRWPRVLLDFQTFERYVRDRVAAGAEPPDRDGLVALFLCCACARGDESACQDFSAHYASILRTAVRRVDRDPAFVDEVTAHCLDKLLVGPPPRLTRYSGHGGLEAWLRRCGSRMALDAKRRRKRVPEQPIESTVVLPTSTSPESALLCRTWGADLASALETALRELDREDKMLLRLHYADGLNVDRIGALCGVHRATVSRWIKKVRDGVDDKVRREMKRRGLDAEDIASLIRGTRPYQEACFRRLLDSGAVEL